MVAEEGKAHVGPGTPGRFDGPRQYEGSSHLIALWTKFPHHQRGLFLIARICLGHRALWGHWSVLSGGGCGVRGRGTFKRRDAQLSSVALLSQLQIFLLGHVLLPPSMALVPQGKVGRPHQNRPQNLGGSSSIPEPREVALPSLSGCELCCHLWMPEHHQQSRPSTSSALLTSPSPSSLPASSAILCPSVTLCPAVISSPQLPNCPGSPYPPASTFLFPYLRAPYSPSSPSLLPCLDLHPSDSRKLTGTAKKSESYFPMTSFPAHPAFTSSEEQEVM